MIELTLHASHDDGTDELQFDGEPVCAATSPEITRQRSDAPRERRNDPLRPVSRRRNFEPANGRAFDLNSNNQPIKR
jgi:hypothetical protein